LLIEYLAFVDGSVKIFFALPFILDLWYA